MNVASGEIHGISRENLVNLLKNRDDIVYVHTSKTFSIVFMEQFFIRANRILCASIILEDIEEGIKFEIVISTPKPPLAITKVETKMFKNIKKILDVLGREHNFSILYHNTLKEI